MFNQNLYNNTCHKEDISRAKFLVMGGAGFIGSNLVEYFHKCLLLEIWVGYFSLENCSIFKHLHYFVSNVGFTFGFDLQ